MPIEIYFLAPDSMKCDETNIRRGITMFLTDVMYASRPTLYNASLHGVLSHPRNYDVKTQPKHEKNKDLPKR